MKSYQSYYEVLGVERSASREEIRRGFSKKAMRLHPDKNQNSPESNAVFLIVKQAFEILSDENERQIYDHYLKFSSGISRMRKTLLLQPSENSLSAVLSHLNVILWDTEDFLDYKRRNLGGEADLILTRELKALLSFFDRWVLTAAGYPDYFYEARRIENPLGNIRPSHRPFVDEFDYFYNIRKRSNKMFEHLRASDTDTEMLSGFFETERYCLFVLNAIPDFLKRGTRIPPYVFSDEKFKNF